MYVVQFREPFNTERVSTLNGAITRGAGAGERRRRLYGEGSEAFDVSNAAGAIVWAWEMRP